jgi:hypothetical protein
MLNADGISILLYWIRIKTYQWWVLRISHQLNPKLQKDNSQCLFCRESFFWQTGGLELSKAMPLIASVLCPSESLHRPLVKIMEDPCITGQLCGHFTPWQPHSMVLGVRQTESVRIANVSFILSDGKSILQWRNLFNKFIRLILSWSAEEVEVLHWDDVWCVFC